MKNREWILIIKTRQLDGKKLKKKLRHQYLCIQFRKHFFEKTSILMKKYRGRRGSYNNSNIKMLNFSVNNVKQ